MQLRCKSSSVWGLVLAVGFLAITGTLAAQAATPPVINGDLSDLESYVDDVFNDGEGCGVAREDLVEDIVNNNFEANPFYPCLADSIVQNGQQLYFPNGFDQVFWAVAYDRVNDQTYLGIRARGVIGDCDGDRDPGRAGACDPPPPGATTVGEEPGISEFDDTYRWNIDDNCDGVIDYRIQVYGPAPDQLTVEVNGVASAGAEAFYSGTELEVRVPGLGLSPIWQASTFTDCIPDAMGEDPSPVAKCQEPRLNVAITKTANPTAICAGETTRFTITVTNTGSTPLDLDLTDTLPAGLTYAGNLGGSCNVTAVANGQIIDFSDFSLDPGQSCTVLFDATADVDCNGTVRNIASVTGTFQDDCLISGENPQGVIQVGPVEATADVDCLEQPCVDQVVCDAPEVACNGDQITVSGSARNCSSGPEDIEICITRNSVEIGCTTFVDVPAGQTVTYDLSVTHTCDGPPVTYNATAQATNDCGSTDIVPGPGCDTNCGVLPCVEANCETSVAQANIGEAFDVTGSATNCSEGPENIRLWLMGPSGQLGDAETFQNVPPGSTVTIVRSFTCEEPGIVMFRAMAEASNSCGETSDQSDNECAVDCQETGFCWMTSGGNYSGNDSKGQKFWTWGGNAGPPPSGNWQHHEFDGNGKTLYNFHAKDVEVFTCFNDGTDGPCSPKGEFNVIIFGGSGTYSIGNGKKTENATFRVQAEDHGEPGNTPNRDGGCGSPDVYEITVWKEDGSVLFSHREFVEGGNIQIHPLKDNQLRRIRGGGGRTSTRPSGPGGGAEQDVTVGDDVFDGQAGLSLQLYQPAPNPFNNSTRIAYAISSGGNERVEIAIFNVAGRKVRTLVSGFQAAGRYEVSWDAVDNYGSKVSPGVYFVSGTIAGQKIPITRVVYTR